MSEVSLSVIADYKNPAPESALGILAEIGRIARQRTHHFASDARIKAIISHSHGQHADNSAATCRSETPILQSTTSATFVDLQEIGVAA